MSITIICNSCKKDEFVTGTDASIYISSDTLKYDTVFTSTGSVTQSFKIFNPNDKKLRLSDITLMGGNTSAFNMNVNGQAGTSISNFDINAFDSIYVFVAVTINPNNQQLPFIISDSIRIAFNGKQQFVQLQAYGQNAHFLRDENIQGNVTWNNDLPYVILGGLTIDTTASLHINAGCRVYAHADAPVLVDGTLEIAGEKNNEVIFTGDRLDPDYRDLPASWPGIFLRNSSADNQFRFAIIKNAYQAIVVTKPAANTTPKLTMHQCIIDNAYNSGIIASSTTIKADNTLISNCGSNIQIIGGGDYEFTNCTAVCYSNRYAIHDKPVLQLTDYNIENGSIVTNDLTAHFNNCIFWGDFGSVEDEIVTDNQGTGTFSVNFDNCLYKALNNPQHSTFNACLPNQDPVFDSVDVSHDYYDFRINNAFSSPAIDNGTLTSFSKDLDDLPRVSGTGTDIGCYEKQ